MKRQFVAICILCMCSFFFMGATTTTQEGTVYTVQKGDTLARIAAKYMPYTAAYTKRELINSIRAINSVTGSLSPGQNLNIPVAWKEPLKPKTISKTKDYVAKGLYMNTANSGTRFVFDSATKLKKYGGNTIVFDAKDDMGAITFPSSIPDKYSPNENYTPNIEELPKLVDYLHRLGIHVVARVVAFRDPIMAKTRPEWCINREKHWLNPGNPEVQEYMLTVIRELTDSGLDEIQLDYVRYFADRKTGSGIEGLSRTDVIAGFLKKAHDVTASKGVLLSVDMFGIVIWQRDVDVLVVGQDVSKIKQHVDIISPMLYPSHFNAGFGGVKNPADDPYRFIFNGVKRMKDLVGDDVIIRPWLQSFPLRITTGFDEKYIRTQIDAAKDAGGTGWLLWSPGNKYGDAYTAMENLLKQKSDAPSQEAKARSSTKETKQSQSVNRELRVAPPAESNQLPATKETTSEEPAPAKHETRNSARNELHRG